MELQSDTTDVRSPDSSVGLGRSAPGRTSLEFHLEPLRPYLKDPEVTEICFYRPGEAFIERGRQWTQASVPFASFEWALRLTKLIGNASRQRVDEGAPLLSAGLPSGERVQCAIPPATLPGHVAIAIRRPSQVAFSIAQLVARGIFSKTQAGRSQKAGEDGELQTRLAGRDFGAFMLRAVQLKKNILVSGPTGSGKTTWTKALIRAIPKEERLITIEDAPELTLDSHPNHVRLFYSKDGQGRSKVTPKELLESCLRLRPDRILLAELRSEEAFYYLRNIASGHPGSITSIHAGSCELALEQLMLMVRQSRGGQGLSREDIHALIRLTVDVVIQFGVEGGDRFISEVQLQS